MKLILAILNNDDAKVIIPKLMDEGFSATTLSTTGGFLKTGNTTMMVATEEENVDKVRNIIKTFSNKRSVINPEGKSGGVGNAAEEITIGGAVLFVMDVKDNFKF